MTDTPGPPRSAPLFRERLLPGPGGWLILVGLGAAFGLVVGPLSPSLAVAVGLFGAVGLVVLGWISSAVIEVTDGRLQAGRAQIPVRLVTAVQPLDAEAMMTARGPKLDARAYLCMRGWVPTGARATIEDPADPTPYWLLSTRHPEALAEAVDRARQG